MMDFMDQGDSVNVGDEIVVRIKGERGTQFGGTVTGVSHVYVMLAVNTRGPSPNGSTYVVPWNAIEWIRYDQRPAAPPPSAGVPSDRVPPGTAG